MSKEKVFIVVSHINRLKSGSRSEWEVQENVEFVNQLRKRHIHSSSAIGDYLNREIISGRKFGFDTYDKFENYVRTKYPDQLGQLDKFYRSDESTLVEETQNLSVDDKGVITVSDTA